MTDDKLIQPQNAPSSILETVSGIVTACNDKQFANAYFEILLIPDGSEMLDNSAQLANAQGPSSYRVFGMATLSRHEQPLKHLSPRLQMPVGRVKDVNPLHIEKQDSQIRPTELPIKTKPAILEQL